MRGLFCQLKAIRGNALTEYGLVGALVLVASVGVLFVLAGGLDNGLNGLKADLLGHVDSAQQAKPGGLPPSLQEAAAQLPPPGAGETPVCFEGGLCLNMPYIQGGVSNTAGGLGSDDVEALANLILRVARQLEAQGADPGLVAKITALANKGHQNATMIKSISNRYNSATDYFQSHAGQPVSDSTIQTMRSSLYGSDKLSFLNGQFNQAWQDVQAAFAQSPNDPKLQLAKQIIDYQAQEIVNISGSVPTNITVEQLQADPNMEIAAQVTRQDANTICQTGGNIGKCYVNTASGWQTP